MDAWIQLLVGLIIAIVGGIIGSRATICFQRHHEKQQDLGQRRFNIYMLLLELNGLHFWIDSSEVHSEAPGRELAQKYQRLAWRIMDELRLADEIPEAEIIVNTLLSLKFQKGSDRSNAIANLIDEMGTKVNP